MFLFGYLPDPATQLQVVLEVLNYNSLVVDAVIVTLILWLLYVIVLVGYVSKIEPDEEDFWYISKSSFETGVKYFNLKENKILEFIWTVLPALIIIAIMLPSIIATYVSELAITSTVPIKIIGNQWFWTAEQTILLQEQEKIVIVESLYLLKNDDAVFLLEADKPLIVPINKRIPFIITSNDVIHSFALPECGIKIDALPGRLNQTFGEFLKIGTYAGMCSELCGVGHAKMPINITVLSIRGYLHYNATLTGK